MNEIENVSQGSFRQKYIDTLTVTRTHTYNERDNVCKNTEQMLCAYTRYDMYKQCCDHLPFDQNTITFINSLCSII